MSFHLYKHLSKKKKITIIDRMMTGASVLHPLTALPQVLKIYTTHTATGVSFPTWFGFMVLGLIFLAYGIVHKIKPFIIMQILWFIMDFLVVLGIILYS